MVNLLNMLDYSRYDVTLQLVEKRGINLEYLPEQVKLRPALKDITWLLDSGKPFIKQALLPRKARRYWEKIVRRHKNAGEKGKLSSKNLMKWQDVKDLFQKEEEHFDVAVAYLQGFPIYYVVDCVNADKNLDGCIQIIQRLMQAIEKALRHILKGWMALLRFHKMCKFPAGSISQAF